MRTIVENSVWVAVFVHHPDENDTDDDFAMNSISASTMRRTAPMTAVMKNLIIHLNAFFTPLPIRFAAGFNRKSMIPNMVNRSAVP